MTTLNYIATVKPIFYFLGNKPYSNTGAWGAWRNGLFHRLDDIFYMDMAGKTFRGRYFIDSLSDNLW